MYYRTQVAVDMDAIEYNFARVGARLAPGVKCLAVIKADAYGHGAVPIARQLDGRCDFFGVACIEEALELVNAGIKSPVLILGHVAPEHYSAVVKYGIRIPIFTVDDAAALSDEAVRQGRTAPFHFAVDTGMSRIGFSVSEDSADKCALIANMPNLFAEGLFSHFATADCADLKRSVVQREQFCTFISMLESRGVNIPIKHLNNSAGIINFDRHFDMCRMGIVLYGLYPSEDVDKSHLSIRPVMSWKTHISYIKTLEPGREISYGGTFTTDREMRIATIPVGYADGYPRCLSNKGRVIINGAYAPIVGRVCMDQFMVDVSHIPDCKIDDEVILVGGQGGTVLSMEEVSQAAHSFNYELPCRISRRVPRVYYKNGKEQFSVSYIK